MCLLGIGAKRGDARTGEPFIFCPELSQSPLSSFYPENVRLIGARKKYEEEGRIDRMEHLAVEKWTDGVTMIFGYTPSLTLSLEWMKSGME